ncbi:hypothetical protein H0H81_002563 [Sphagnurus paluster]|uniref:Fungal lipase-type domain-containing protein n=1 Tax=Sphagnurus paluster TaxID=117069 RepID=A0A9P7GN13_9AGAR|nr:hypothetical protein H0H81_002563 [Sphagnurus paluster]
MRFSSLVYVCTALLALNPLVALASPVLETRADGISQAVFDDLVRYTKYSSAVYEWICPNPLGNKLVQKFNNVGTQGFVVRDDQRKEIVVAFRGTLEVIDVLVDLQFILTPLKSTGINAVGDAHVHSGFLFAYNIVANDVLSIVKGQVAAYPNYSLVVTGHSLGGATASIAALSIRAAHPSLPIKLYTYGA